MRLGALIPLLACVLSACGVPQTPEAFNKTPEAQFLRVVVDKLAVREFAFIESQLDPKLVEPDVRSALERTAAALPAEAVAAVQPVAWRVGVSTNGPRTATVAAEYAYPSSKWFVVSAQLTGEAGSFRILRLNVEPLPAPMAQLNAFTFQGKGAMHYAFFLFTLSAFALSVYAFVQCLRTKGIRRKWLWAIFTLLGFCAFTLNWSSGAVSINPLSFNLFSAGFGRAGWVGPWGLTFCIPIGAIVFLWKHRHVANTPPIGG
ncbi:hypothetical protein [Ideonella sp. BN130291]|uniref:hypothetical protein n=1 Tax=Ideonella sp. BN130291 TaxID=3112940 RepID=UPI002E263915|nr:hypothetical protein [Ideonella sp. BN130291]